jgi:hypothetical protein
MIEMQEKSISSNIPCYTILCNDSKSDGRVGQEYGGTLGLHQMIQDIAHKQSSDPCPRSHIVQQSTSARPTSDENNPWV